MLEKSASGLQVVQADGKRKLAIFHGSDVVEGPTVAGKTVLLRLQVEGNQVTYFYSLDEGKSFRQLGDAMPITFSWWKGSRPSLFAYTVQDAEGGYVDFDWARYTSLTFGRDIRR
jgi:hypothetical protein